MRSLFVLALVAGCHSDPSSPTDTAAEMAALSGRVADLEESYRDRAAQLQLVLGGRIAALESTVAAWQATAPGKVPHLILRETGEPLGQLTGGDLLCFYSVEAKGEICVRDNHLLQYPDPGCTGTPIFSGNSSRRASLLFVDHGGTVWRDNPEATEREMRGASRFDGTECEETPTSGVAVMRSLEDTGVRFPLRRVSEFAIEPR